jgi:hypothetical protein
MFLLLALPSLLFPRDVSIFESVPCVQSISALTVWQIQPFPLLMFLPLVFPPLPFPREVSISHCF